MKANKIDWVLLIIIAGVFAAAYCYCFREELDFNGDNARYIELARNLAKMHGYFTEGVNGTRVPHIHFPIGYPFILSVLITAGLDNLIAFKILNGIFMLLSLLLLYFIIKEVSGNRGLALSVCVLSALSTRLLYFSSIVMSEMSFMFFMILTLFALMRITKSEEKYGIWFWVAALSAVSCYYLRAVGSAVVFCVLVFYVFRKEWKEAAVSTGTTILCIVPWLIRNRMLGAGRDYIGPVLAKNPWRPELGRISSFGEFMEKVYTNLSDTTLCGYHIILFPNWKGYLATPVSTFNIVIGAVLMAAVFYGLWKTGVLRYAIVSLMLANLFFLLIWNGQNDIRYVTPFIPLIIFGFWNCVCFFAYGIFSLLGIKKYYSFFPFVILLMVLIYQPVVKRAHDNQAADPCPAEYKQYFAIAKELERMIPTFPDKPVVACRKPELFKYYAPDAIPITYLFSNDKRAVVEHLYKNGVAFVVLDCLQYSSTVRYLFPAILEYSDLFSNAVISKKVKNKQTILLFFDREKAGLLLNGQAED